MIRVRSGLQKAWKTFREEKRLECPFPVPKTLLGRVAGGLFVGTTATAGVIGGFLGITHGVMLIGEGAGKAYVSVRKSYDEIPSVKERHQQEEKTGEEIQKLRKQMFNDPEYYNWHRDTPHFAMGVAATVGALFGFTASRKIFRSSKLAHNFCQHGVLWSLATFVGGASTVATGAAVGNLHASYCKRNQPFDAKAARLKHQSLILYKIPHFQHLVG